MDAEDASWGKARSTMSNCVAVGYKDPAELDEAIENLNLALA